MEIPFLHGQTPKPQKGIKALTIRRNRSGNQQQKRKKQQNESPSANIVFRPNSRSEQTVHRVLRQLSTVSSTAGGTITAFNILASNVNSAAPDWNNIAQEFQDYRVKYVQTHFFPATTTATITTGPYQSGMIACPLVQQAVVSSSVIIQSNETQFFSTLEEKQIRVERPKGPNFNNWTLTTAATPALADFGYGAISASSNMAVSSVIYNVVHEWGVEFRLAL